MALPTGWMKATDPQSGRMYYANPGTGETQWNPPMALGGRRTAVSDGQKVIQDIHEVSQQLSNARSSSDSIRDTMIEVELQGLTGGQIADLAHLQQGGDHSVLPSAIISSPTRSTNAVNTYAPLEPNQFALNVERQPGEQARLQTRLHSLTQNLKEI